MGRLLVSVRGPDEALAAAEGGAHIADVDVICVRGAACSPSQGEERFGAVEESIVRELVNTKE